MTKGSNYINYGVTLSHNQIKHLKRASDKNVGLIIRLQQKNLHGSMHLPLTVAQINRIKKAKNGVELNLSKHSAKTYELIRWILTSSCSSPSDTRGCRWVVSWNSLSRERYQTNCRTEKT